MELRSKLIEGRVAPKISDFKRHISSFDTLVEGVKVLFRARILVTQTLVS